MKTVVLGTLTAPLQRTINWVPQPPDPLGGDWQLANGIARDGFGVQQRGLNDQRV
ncbi:MAG TPA: hypothetical protein VF637_03800 [Sphingomicrobium sp.]